MKTLLNIGVHSFTDAISNSSSETMICAGNQTISTIKQVIEKLVNIYNSQSELYNTINRDKEHFWAQRIISKSEIWTDIFEEPKIAEFEVTIPEKVKELDRYYNNDWSINNSNWIANREFNFRANEIKTNEELKQYIDDTIKYPNHDLLKADKKAYDKLTIIYNKYYNKIGKIRRRLEKKYHKKWYKYCEQQILHMWQLNCTQNNINFEDLGKYTFSHWNDNVSIYFNRERPPENNINPLPENIQNFISEMVCCENLINLILKRDQLL